MSLPSLLRGAQGARPTALRGRGLLALALAFFAFAGLAIAAPRFPPLTGRVVDDAHMLSAGAAQQLDVELAALEQATGHQLVVATVPDLQGYEIEEYGYQLGRAWALGQKGKNDGAILLVAPNERKVRIEVGYGLEPVLTDALSSVIIQEKVLPQFKAGHMEQGILDGAAAIAGQLGLPEDQAMANVARAKARPNADASGANGVSHFPVLLVIVIVFWVLSSILRGGRGGGLWWLPLMLLNSGGGRRDDWGGGGGGGFSGGGGSFGGGGSSGNW
jgi:uncharacterized protein